MEHVIFFFFNLFRHVSIPRDSTYVSRCFVASLSNNLFIRSKYERERSRIKLALKGGEGGDSR